MTSPDMVRESTIFVGVREPAIGKEKQVMHPRQRGLLSAAGRTRLPRCLAALLTFAFVLPLVSSAWAQERANPAETRKALAEAKKIKQIVRKAMAEDGVLSAEIIERIAKFYNFGTGTDALPGDDVVTRKFAREWVLALYAEIFGITKNAKQESNTSAGDAHPKLNATSARLLRQNIETCVESAMEELSPAQRIRLYRLAGIVLNSSHQRAIDTLTYFEQHRAQDLTSGELPAMQKAKEAISNREPPAGEITPVPESS
jgi:hypothetical protein